MSIPGGRLVGRAPGQGAAGRNLDAIQAAIDGLGQGGRQDELDDAALEAELMQLDPGNISVDYEAMEREVELLGVRGPQAANGGALEGLEAEIERLERLAAVKGPEKPRPARSATGPLASGRSAPSAQPQAIAAVKAVKRVELWDAAAYRACASVEERRGFVERALRIAQAQAHGVARLLLVRRENARARLFARLRKAYDDDLARLARVPRLPNALDVVELEYPEPVQYAAIPAGVLVLGVTGAKGACAAGQSLETRVALKVPFEGSSAAAGSAAPAALWTLPQSTVDPLDARLVDPSPLSANGTALSSCGRGPQPEMVVAVRVPLGRGASAQRRFLERTRVQVTLQRTRGWFRSDEPLGVGSVSLRGLLERAYVVQWVPLASPGDSQRETGIQVCIHAALRQAVGGEQVNMVTAAFPLVDVGSPAGSAALGRELNGVSLPPQVAAEQAKGPAPLSKANQAALAKLVEAFGDPKQFLSNLVLEREIASLDAVIARARQERPPDATEPLPAEMERLVLVSQARALARAAETGELSPQVYRGMLEASIPIQRTFAERFARLLQSDLSQRARVRVELMEQELAELSSL